MKPGKHSRCGIRAICLVLGLSGPAWSACDRILYSTNPNYPPYSWVNKSGKLEGASLDLLRRVAPHGIALVEVVYPWKRAMALAEQGKIDLLLSLRITPEREKGLIFTSRPAFPNPITAFVRKDLSINYKGWADLKGMSGAISAGDTFGFGFDEYLRSELTFEEGYTLVQNFHKLALGRIDYFVSGKYLGEAYLAQTGLDKDIMALTPPLTSGDIYFALSRHSPCAAYLDEISANLGALDSAGENVKILQKNLELFRQRKVGDVFAPFLYE